MAANKQSLVGKAYYIALKRAISALLLGSIVAVLTIVLAETNPRNRVTQVGLDTAMWLHAGAPPEHEAPARYVIFDLDDATCESWRLERPTACDPGSDFLLEQYATALNVAAYNAASAIVIDLDLSKALLGGGEGTPGERAMRSAIQASPTPIFVPVPMRTVGGNSGRTQFRAVRTILDTDMALAPSAYRHVHMGHVVWRPDGDGILRRPITCLDYLTPSGEPAAEPLRALALLVADSVRERTGTHTEHARQEAERPCSPRTTSEPRLVFAMPYERPILRNMSEWPVVDDAPLVSSYSMLRVVAASIDPVAIPGAIVLIGSGRSDSDDWHLTPLGRTPGVWVILNHIHAALNYRPLVVDTPHLIREKALITLSLSALIGVFWFFVALWPKQTGLGRLFQLVLITVWYLIVVFIALLGVVLYASNLARPALAHGYVVEPVTPALAVLLETTLEGVRFVLERLDRVSRFIASFIAGPRSRLRRAAAFRMLKSSAGRAALTLRALRNEQNRRALRERIRNYISGRIRAFASDKKSGSPSRPEERADQP